MFDLIITCADNTHRHLEICIIFEKGSLFSISFDIWQKKGGNNSMQYIILCFFISVVVTDNTGKKIFMVYFDP